MSTDNDTQGEIGVVTTHTIRLDLPEAGFALDCGRTLAAIDVAYETYGERAPTGDNVVFVCHALSGSAHAAGRHEPPDADGDAGWWDDMIGPGKGIDTNHYHVVCANILGGCRGTTGPASLNPATGQPYGSSFPDITVGDIVGVHRQLLLQLGIPRVAAVIGGSFGGMQALEWAIRFPDSVERCIVIASSAGLSAQGLAFDIVGRKAITNDPDWQGGDYYASGRSPDRGLALARKVGHITYLSREIMDKKFGREKWTAEPEVWRDSGESRVNKFQVQTYLEYQGEKFTKRFDANAYLQITRAMDEYDVVARYGSLEKAFAAVQAKLLVVAVSSDWLFPPEDSEDIANALLCAKKPVSYCLLNAPHGHDAFLLDVEHLSDVLCAFLPWVGVAAGDEALRAGGRRKIKHQPTLTTRDRADAYAAVLRMIQPGSRVLDIGSGNGQLLTLLADQKQVSGVGVDIDLEHVIEVIDRGHDVFQADIDGGLAMLPDHQYDYAILSETLQVVKRPRFVLDELLRVAKEGIVSFPNFGKWHHRLALTLFGRMPKGQALPYEWYETPNIHLFTYLDFVKLCRRDGIRIVEKATFSKDWFGRVLTAIGLPNLGADFVLVRITRGESAREDSR